MGRGALRLHSASSHGPGYSALLPDARRGHEPGRIVFISSIGGLIAFPMNGAYHAANGVRLVLVELGFAVGKPIEPVYPYKTSLGVQRPLLIAMMILAAIFLAAGGYSFLGLGK